MLQEQGRTRADRCAGWQMPHDKRHWARMKPAFLSHSPPRAHMLQRSCTMLQHCVSQPDQMDGPAVG